MKYRVVLMLLLVVVLTIPAGMTFGQDVVELNITWYDDGVESQVLRGLLDEFEAANPDIKVVLNVVGYADGIQNLLPIQLDANDGPDMARITDLGGQAEHYLDMRPYLSATTAEYWEENFGPFLNWHRLPGDTEGIYGIQNQLTVTGPFINRTLFELAGVEVPSDTNENVTWEEWGLATKQVADALGDEVWAMAMDRSGHRLSGPAISMGAMWFDEDGYPALDDEGMRAMASLFAQWHEDGTMLPDIWIGPTGYAGANDQFKAGELVFYMSGSWQIAQFTNDIGDDFDWQVVPAPCGPGGCTGMPGGAALFAIDDTDHPEEVVRVMEFLALQENLVKFHAGTLFVPAHKGVATGEIPWETDLGLAKDALTAFASQVPSISPVAFQAQAYQYNSLMFNALRDRVTQVLVGELSMDEAFERMQDDVDKGLAEAGVE